MGEAFSLGVVTAVALERFVLSGAPLSGVLGRGFDCRIMSLVTGPPKRQHRNLPVPAIVKTPQDSALQGAYSRKSVVARLSAKADRSTFMRA